MSNAAAVGRMDIVQLLLDHGADPNLPEEQYAPKGKALYSAVYHGHYDIARLLLERRAYPNPPVESSGDAVWIAQEWRPDQRMEQLLLSYGAKSTMLDADAARLGRQDRSDRDGQVSPAARRAEAPARLRNGPHR